MANMVRWDPARDMVSLREAMDRLFEESFLRPGFLGGNDSAAGLMPLDVYETQDDVVVKAAIPGVKPEDIDVTVTGDLLTIKGEFKSELEDKDEKRNYHRQERRYGSFSRQVTLPSGVNADACQADFENGVLTLKLPKAEAAKVKRVQVGRKNES
jgi:HSP20 family protein